MGVIGVVVMVVVVAGGRRNRNGNGSRNGSGWYGNPRDTVTRPIRPKASQLTT